MRTRAFRELAPFLIVGLMMLVATIAGTGFLLAGKSDGQPATTDQERQFIQLYQQYRRIHFEASVSGDVSQLSSIFTSDPAVDLAKYSPDCIPLIELEIDGVMAALASSGLDPDTTVGLLSCIIAEQIDYHANVNAWKSAKERAAAEQRQPATQDLPDGSSPVEPTGPQSWTDHTMYVISAEMFGDDRAHVAYSAKPEHNAPDLLFNMIWTRVESQWRASAIWTTGNP